LLGKRVHETGYYGATRSFCARDFGNTRPRIGKATERAFAPALENKCASSPNGDEQGCFNAARQCPKRGCAPKASTEASRNDIAHVSGELALARYIIKRLLRPGLSLRLQGTP
jgi:hypothetical protein